MVVPNGPPMPELTLGTSIVSRWNDLLTTWAWEYLGAACNCWVKSTPQCHVALWCSSRSRWKVPPFKHIYHNRIAGLVSKGTTPLVSASPAWGLQSQLLLGLFTWVLGIEFRPLFGLLRHFTKSFFSTASDLPLFLKHNIFFLFLKIHWVTNGFLDKIAWL